RADYAQAIQLRVQVLSALARYDEALVDAERLIKESPDHEDYALLQAETLAAAGRCAEAEAACEKVSELNPFNIEAHALLSRLAEQSGDLAKAITHCDDAIALQPANPNLYDRRAALLRKNNAPEAAEEDVKKAADLRAGEHDE
ncbi:MAG: tetratricopeptide repeat protein, partial [Alloprevotella tannerae]|nr:tetratricopeptide repeat protein [Alloprevotella tannerae]